jgi:HD-GYP domain-containing protein (c-di-GMP phosphodiesterase class II)
MCEYDEKCQPIGCLVENFARFPYNIGGIKQISGKSWIAVRKSNLKYYDDVELFYRNPSGKIMLYKPAKKRLTEKELEDKPYLGTLYIRPDDKLKALRGAQRGFSTDLTDRIMKGRLEDLVEIKRDLTVIIDETLSEPRSGHLGVLPDYVSSIVDGYATQPELIKYLARIAHTDYSTAIHSLNVMALTIGYCYHTKQSMEKTRTLALSALLHDIGKPEINPEILIAPRRLTDKEFSEMQQHPLIGVDILTEYGSQFAVAIPGMLHHHLRLDGTGYPEGLRGRPISEAGRLLAIIDSYEVMTNDDRMYRSAIRPYDALVELKKEVDAGKYDRKIFAEFAYSLVDSQPRNELQKLAVQQMDRSDVARIADHA